MLGEIESGVFVILVYSQADGNVDNFQQDGMQQQSNTLTSFRLQSAESQTVQDSEKQPIGAGRVDCF